ncbi:Cell cycle checkpoint protein RAD17 [Linum perenne]
MGKRRNVVVISSEDDEDDDRLSSRRNRSNEKRKPKQKLITLTNPRDSKTKKKPRISNSQPQLTRESSFVEEAPIYIRLSFEEFNESYSRPKVSSGCGEKNTKDLWVDKYAPRTLEDLAVHKKKVEEVQRWFEDKMNVLKGSSASNVLIITGPAGVGKSATIHVLASHFGARLYEWNTPIPTTWLEHLHSADTGIRYTSKLDEFVNFVEKIRKYGLLPTSTCKVLKESFVLLIDDLPLVNGRIPFEKLQNCLLLLTRTAQVPTVIVVSESGKADSADQASRTLEELQSSVESAGACKVAFNPITHNSMKKALTRICLQEHCNNVSVAQIDLIAKASGGDIRHAITSLQLFCVKSDSKAIVSLPSANLSCSYLKAGDIDDLVNGVSLLFGKDETLSLFHALGKFLHNKRGAEVTVALDQAAYLVQEKFYRFPLQMEAPEKVLCQAHGQARPIADFLHENILDFISDEAMDDASDVTAYLSDADMLLSSFRGQLARYNEAENILQSAAASVACRGVLFGNAHPSPRRWHSIRKPKLWQVEHFMLDNKRKIETHRFMAYGGCSSLDMTNLATEFTSMLRLQGNGAPRNGLNQHAETTNPDKSSEISEDEIEDFSE